MVSTDPHFGVIQLFPTENGADPKAEIRIRPLARDSRWQKGDRFVKNDISESPKNDIRLKFGHEIIESYILTFIASESKFVTLAVVDIVSKEDYDDDSRLGQLAIDAYKFDQSGKTRFGEVLKIKSDSGNVTSLLTLINPHKLGKEQEL